MQEKIHVSFQAQADSHSTFCRATKHYCIWETHYWAVNFCGFWKSITPVTLLILSHSLTQTEWTLDIQAHSRIHHKQCMCVTVRPATQHKETCSCLYWEADKWGSLWTRPLREALNDLRNTFRHIYYDKMHFGRGASFLLSGLVRVMLFRLYGITPYFLQLRIFVYCNPKPRLIHHGHIHMTN